MGVPRIYGFSSVAPLGYLTAPLLERYFRSKGDYWHYLDQAAWHTGPNRELLTAFAGTGLVQTSGLSASESTAADRAQICTLYDESRSAAERLRLVQRFLDRSDFFKFLPTIEVFIGRHPAQGLNEEERRIFAEIQQHDAARDQVLDLVRGLIVSALKIEMANLAVHLGWMTPEEFRALAVHGARELLAQRLTSELVDIMCEIRKHEPIGSEFGSGDLPERLFQDAEGLRLVDCLAPTDGAVSARLMAGLDSLDGLAQQWAAYALSRRLPLDDPLLLRIAPYLNHPSADVRLRLQWMLRSQRSLSEDVLLAVRAYDASLAEELRPREKPHRRFPW